MRLRGKPELRRTELSVSSSRQQRRWWDPRDDGRGGTFAWAWVGSDFLALFWHKSAELLTPFEPLGTMKADQTFFKQEMSKLTAERKKILWRYHHQN